MTLQELIAEEQQGTIFCKIGKSSPKINGKGAHCPYRDYVGKNIKCEHGAITFERLEDVINYLHYGDDLIIFNFTKAKEKLPNCGYEANLLNKNCYDTKNIYVESVLSFKDSKTVDFIFSNFDSNKLEKFKNIADLASSHLIDRGLFESSTRWIQLANRI